MAKRKIFCITAIVIGAILILGYTLFLPFLFSNQIVVNFAQKLVFKTTGVELKIKNPVLKTGLSPKIYFEFGEITAYKGGAPLFITKDFKTAFSFDPIFKKEIKFKKLGIDYLYLDVDKMTELVPKSKGGGGKNPYKINIFNSIFYINECEISSSITNETKLKLNGRKILIEEKKNPKHVRFIFDADITRKNQTVKFKFSDNNKFYIENRTLIIDDCPLAINNSKILIKSLSNESSFGLILKSKDFVINDGANILALNIFLPNGSDIINELNDIKGTSDFYIRADNNGLAGGIRVKNASFKLKSLANLPVYAKEGKINIKPDKITISGFIGHYGALNSNKLSMDGTVEDYYKTADTEIIIKTVMTDDFTRNYLSKLIGAEVTMTGKKPAGTLVKINSKNNDIDITYIAKINSGDDILIEGSSLTPVKFDRAIKCDMHLKDNILNIESVKYYIAKTINRQSKIEPVITMSGNIDIADNSKVLNFGFEIPKPLPSEFLNLFLGPGFFKKGQISGGIQWLNAREIPKLKGKLTLDKVIVPSQRLFIKEGRFSTNREKLKFSSKGFFRRSEYELSGDITNSITFPITINNFNFSLDNIDIARLLQAPAVSNQGVEENFVNAVERGGLETDDAPAPAFVPGLVVLKEGVFNLKRGSFKDIEFGNVKAVISLDEKGILNIKSNRFDFAKGHSGGKITCDLAKNSIHAVLGVKEIDSDIVASALLDLKREITGLASGIIDVSMDSTMKLNGKMKFEIKDGAIEKIGFVEYALNFVSLFRNPMAMISPSTLFDLVNIPEGKFDKIWGELSIEDNIVKKMMIKSSAKQLATLIMGRFNLETRDASLRIYTKFTNKNKGAAGFLRKFSLNSLANRGTFGSSNTENYYSAELELIPEIEADDKDCQVFLTTVDGDVEHNNFLSALKKIK